MIMIMIRMATEGMAIMSEAMEPGQGPQLGHRLPQVDHHDHHDEYDRYHDQDDDHDHDGDGDGDHDGDDDDGKGDDCEARAGARSS